MELNLHAEIMHGSLSTLRAGKKLKPAQVILNEQLRENKERRQEIAAMTWYQSPYFSEKIIMMLLNACLS